MDELTRRGALKRTTSATLLGSLVPAAGALAADDPAEVPKEERGRVLSIAMT
jgi:hypothetical protein